MPLLGTLNEISLLFTLPLIISLPSIVKTLNSPFIFSFSFIMTLLFLIFIEEMKDSGIEIEPENFNIKASE
jgi:hypothetical protein